MGYQLVDDLTGQPLDRDHPSIDLRVGLEGWRLYLSDASKKELMKALKPFTDAAEPMEPPRAATPRKATSGRASANPDAKAARIWAMETGFKYTNAAGEERTLGDRGVVPDAVIQAWKEAGSPGVGD